MKRLLILLLAVVLCLSGCKENAQSDLPGVETVPEGIDWKLWEQYVPATLTLGQEQVDVLPICVVPLLVTTLMVAVKDLMLAIASNRSARSVWDSVMVRSAVPFDQVLAESARYSVDPL